MMLQRRTGSFGAWRPAASVRQTVLAAGVGLGVVLAVAFALRPTAIRELDNRAYDILLGSRTQPPQRTPPRVTIVDVDEASLGAEGQWPWPRYRVAELVDKLHGAGAAAIGIDFVFAEPDRQSLDRVRDTVERDLHLTLDLANVPDELKDNDATLGRSLSAGAILGTAFTFEGSGVATPDGPMHAPGVAVVRQAGAPPVVPVPVATGVLRPVPPLDQAVRSVGFVNVLPDGDGKVRRAPLLISHGGRLYPSLALATVMASTRATQVLVLVSSAGVEEVRIGPRRIPVDRQGSLLLPFRPDVSSAFARVSAADVLADRIDAARIRGRTVLIGSTAAGTGDSHPTPVDRRVPGVFLHAVAADALLSQTYLLRPAWATGAEFVAALLCLALATVLLAGHSLRRYAGVTVVIVLACWYGSRALLASEGMFISPVAPLATLAAAFVVLGLTRFRGEELQVLRRTRDLSAAQDCALSGLAAVAETRDPDTGAHIVRTRAFVRALAARLAAHPRFGEQLDPERQESISKSAPLHDIGKVGVPDAILLKPGALTDSEFTVMRQHATIGAQALNRASRLLGAVAHSFLQDGEDMAGGHHERWDGTGYPRGLKGHAIPLSARLMSVADVYDALRARRPYKAPMSHQAAVELIVKGSGTQFDPDVVTAFVEIEREFAQIADEHPDEE